MNTIEHIESLVFLHIRVVLSGIYHSILLLENTDFSDLILRCFDGQTKWTTVALKA